MECSREIWFHRWHFADIVSRLFSANFFLLYLFYTFFVKACLQICPWLFSGWYLRSSICVYMKVRVFLGFSAKFAISILALLICLALWQHTSDNRLLVLMNLGVRPLISPVDSFQISLLRVFSSLILSCNESSILGIGLPSPSISMCQDPSYEITH